VAIVSLAGSRLAIAGGCMSEMIPADNTSGVLMVFRVEPKVLMASVLVATAGADGQQKRCCIVSVSGQYGQADDSW